MAMEAQNLKTADLRGQKPIAAASVITRRAMENQQSKVHDGVKSTSPATNESRSVGFAEQGTWNEIGETPFAVNNQVPAAAN